MTGAMMVKITSMDPLTGNSFVGEGCVYLAIYNRLLRKDDAGKLVPELAKSWTVSPDGKRVTFELQQGVTFHDGTPFNAQAVKFNYDRLLNPKDATTAYQYFTDVESFEAVGVPVLTDRFDIANARLRFSSGCVANITASRISRDRTRKIRFFQRDAYISIDTGAREAEVYRLMRTEGRRPAIEGGKIPVPEGEPLRLELQDFVDAVRFGRAPLVGGDDGRRAVALAAAITERMAACTRI